MREITIPGFKTLRLGHLVVDFNGTLARDGMLIGGIEERLIRLVPDFSIHVLTGNTFGTAREVLAGVVCQLSILPAENQDEAILSYVKRLGYENVVCVGNGRNDRLMLEAAALGIAVIQAEGASWEALAAADIVCSSILEALDLLIYPLRLIATLRS